MLWEFYFFVNFKGHNLGNSITLISIEKGISMKPIFTAQLSWLLLYMPLYIQAAAPATASHGQQIALRSYDGTAITLPQSAVELSGMLQGMISERILDYDEACSVDIPQQVRNTTVTKDLLQRFASALQVAYRVRSNPLPVRYTVIENAVLQELSTMGKNNTDGIIDLWNLIEFFDTEILKYPVAEVMLHSFSANMRDKCTAKKVIMSLAELHIDYRELQNLLAKAWYLNYGNKGDFIFEEDPAFDYGFSIEELGSYGKLPGKISGSLDLTNLRINELTGLREIENIKSVTTIRLDNNRLTTLPQGIFQGLNSLQELHLDGNRLITLPQGIFQGLNCLYQLHLFNNKLTKLPQGIFHGLNGLWQLSLCDNRLTTLPQGIFQGLNSLQQLRLDNNRLITLPQGIFHGLNCLQELHLDNNQLITLPQGIFHGLALWRLQLEHNPLSTNPHRHP